MDIRLFFFRVSTGIMLMLGTIATRAQSDAACAQRLTLDAALCDSKLVFKGTPTKFDTVRATDMMGRMEDRVDAIRVTFLVQEMLKGITDSIVHAHVPIGKDRIPMTFEANKKYLVFAKRNKGQDILFIDPCGNTRPISDSANSFIDSLTAVLKITDYEGRYVPDMMCFNFDDQIGINLERIAFSSGRKTIIGQRAELDLSGNVQMRGTKCEAYVKFSEVDERTFAGINERIALVAMPEIGKVLSFSSTKRDEVMIEYAARSDAGTYHIIANKQDATVEVCYPKLLSPVRE